MTLANNNTPTEERKNVFFINFRNTKRIQWSDHRRFCL